jgi:hypothetical protein
MRIIGYVLFSLITVSITAQDTVSKKDIVSAAKIFDLNYTQQEIDTMYDGVKENVLLFKMMHQQTLNNSVPMSMYQHPVLPGMVLNSKQAAIQWPEVKCALPKNKKDLAFYSIEQLAYLLKSKKITSVALTQFFIDRVKQYGDTLQCLISLTEDLAMQQAKQADAEIAAGKYKGLLHGIP